MRSTVSELLEVVDRGWCIGCGACAALADSPLTMELDEHGRYRPVLRDVELLQHEGDYLEVCPFTASTNEDEIASTLVADQAENDERLGRFRELGAGHVAIDAYRTNASSGGMTTWFVATLLRRDLVDAVLHVHPGHDSGELFGYSVSRTLEEVTAGAKTRYHPVEMSDVLPIVREQPGRYAIVGLPCFIKAVRLLQRSDAVIRERIRYCVGLVCGHLKSRGFAEALAWELGIPPEELAGIDFRQKSDRAADDYDVVAVGRDGETRRAPSASLFASDWGLGMFKYPACDLCDDVTAETADISFGDAWLPDYAGDPRGANIYLARSSAALDVMHQHRDELSVAPLTPDEVARSQAAGLRHRREGLAHRLTQRIRQGQPVPKKRVSPSSGISPQRTTIYDLRSAFIPLVDQAFAEAKARSSFRVFRARLRPAVRRYRKAYEVGVPWRRRLKNRAKRLFPWLPGVIGRLRR